MSSVRNALRNPHFASIAALVTLVFFVAEWVVSASWRGYYGYRNVHIGPLGVPFCGPSGNWPCSSLYPAMNVALFLTGVAVAAVALSWTVRKAVTVPHGVLLVAAGVGLGCTGVITERHDYPAHSVAMSMFMMLAPIGVFLVGASSSTELPSKAKRFAALAGLVAVIGYFAYVGGFTLGLGSGGIERMTVYPVLVALIVLSWSDRNEHASQPLNSADREVVSA